MAAQMIDPYPGKNQQARVVDYPRQILTPPLPVISSPPSPRRQGYGRSRHQDTAQQARLAVDKVALRTPKGLAIAQIMVTLHVFIPQPGSLFALERLQPYRTHLREFPNQRRSGIGSLGGRRPAGLVGVPARHRPLARQPHHASVLQLLQDL